MLNTLNDMKIRILRGDKGKWYHNTDNISKEFRVIDYYDSSILRFLIEGGSWVDKNDCVITDLPKSFCVKRCNDTAKWKKYIDWLNRIYDKHLIGDVWRYYGANSKGECDQNKPFGTELHIDDIIKHIDFYSEPMVVESEEEFDMTTNEGRLAYAIKYYPIGTKYRGYDFNGNVAGDICKVLRTPRDHQYDNIDAGPDWIYIHKFNKWAEIINEVKEEEKMETQKLSRQGLKEIHSVACSSWKRSLELLGASNPLEDYIELNQDQIDAMFKACNIEQLPIVAKYLKQDDGSVDLSEITGVLSSKNNLGLIALRLVGDYSNNAFWLNDRYNWEIKKDNHGVVCLIPTKKKQSLTSSGPTAYGEVNTATAYTSGTTTGKYSVGF
jgi:hypothetical protein